MTDMQACEPSPHFCPSNTKPAHFLWRTGLWTILWLCAVSIAHASSILQTMEQEFMELVNQAEPTVVEVRVIKQMSTSNWSGNTPLEGPDFGWLRPGTATYRQRHVGSGWVYDTQGHIITTAGIVDNAERLDIRFSDGRVYEAKLVGKDSVSDIAVLRTSTTELPQVDIGDSRKIGAGAWVVTIGRSYGNAPSLSFGIVSGIEPLPGRSFCPVIKFNAPINPGNTGGSVFNSSGEVVGMVVAALASPHRQSMSNLLALDNPPRLIIPGIDVTVAEFAKLVGFQLESEALYARLYQIEGDEIVAETSGELAQFWSQTVPRGKLLIVSQQQSLKASYALEDLQTARVSVPERAVWWQEVGFALPVHFIEPIAQELIEHGKVTRGWLGVTTLDRPSGVTVLQVVPNGPAHRAGLQPGDCILQVNGKPLVQAGSLQHLVVTSEPGKRIDLDIRRGDQEHHVKVKLGQLPN